MINKLKKLFERFFFNIKVKEYINLNKKRFNSNVCNKESTGIILVDFLDSYPLHETYSYIVNSISQKEKLKIKYFKFDYDKYDLILFFLNPKLKKIYNSFNAYKGFTYNLKYLVFSFYKTKNLLNNIKTKEDVINLSIDGMNIGDLVYDTYLRKYDKKTLHVDSKKFYFTLFQTILILKSIDSYFSKNKIKAVLPGDVAYIFSGLICKYAIKNDIKVYSIVETNGFLITKLQEINYYRRMPYWDYPKIFDQFSDVEKEENINKSIKILESRLSGKKDKTLVYMSKSAFNLDEKRVLSDNKKIKILIPLHDFFDSPHIYRSMLFPDFWEWIIFTLENAKKTNFEWYIKPHPNALPQNEKLIVEIKERFSKHKNIIFLDSDVSNLTIINDGINAVFTVYGSVGHEFSYKDIVVVNAGDNPHIGYSFNIHAKTIEHYLDCIKNVDKLNININKKEIAEFFYVHYLFFKPLKLLNPVYPPSDYISLNNIENFTSKNKRIIYHKSSKTLSYFIDNYSIKKHVEINQYLNKVL